MAMKSAFCCATLRTGTLIVGWMRLFEIIAIIIMTTAAIIAQEINRNDYDLRGVERHNQFQGSRLTKRKLYTIIYLGYALSTLLTVSLLYGAYKKRPGFIIPYLVIFGLVVVGNACALIYYIINGPYRLALVPAAIFVPIEAYCICIVGSYYSQLSSNDDRNLKSQA